MYTFTKRKDKPLFIPSTLQRILNALQEQGIRPILVGGCVRDYFLNKNIKDYDIELFNCNDISKIEAILHRFGKVQFVGKSFGVYKVQIKNDVFDFSLPRVEKKIALGHKGFDIACDGMMSFKQACLRRDFTMNAMGYDVYSKCFLDPFNALEDLHEKRLQHINDDTFVQDALRVYRAIGFCARFDLQCSPTTLQLCQKIVQSPEIHTLSLHRIFTEFKKLFLKSKIPSKGLQLLQEVGLFDVFTQLKLLNGNWEVALNAVDNIAQCKTNDTQEKLILLLSTLMHAFWSVEVFKTQEEVLSNVQGLLKKICNDNKIIQEVLKFQPYSFTKLQYTLQKKEAKMQIALWAKDIKLHGLFLILKAHVDANRDKKSQKEQQEVLDRFLDYVKEQGVLYEAKKPLVQGKDLIALCFKPSKAFSHILHEAYKLQLSHPKLEKKRLLQLIKNKFDV